MNDSNGGFGQIVLRDMSGVVHQLIELAFYEGWNTMTIDIKDLPAGAYTISYVRKNGKTITKSLFIAGK